MSIMTKGCKFMIDFITSRPKLISPHNFQHLVAMQGLSVHSAPLLQFHARRSSRVSSRAGRSLICPSWQCFCPGTPIQQNPLPLDWSLFLVAQSLILVAQNLILVAPRPVLVTLVNRLRNDRRVSDACM